MNKEEYTKIGILIFNEVEKEQEVLRKTYPSLQFRPQFKFNLAMKIKEVWNSDK